MMTLRLGTHQTLYELFCVPDDYPCVETEDGGVLPPGHYFWVLREDGAPDGYPCGPYGTQAGAIRECQEMAAPAEMLDE